MVRFHFVTLFEEACDAYLNASIIGRARSEKKIKVAYQNPRDFVENKWGKVDERPYGGGPGMVIAAMPVVGAVQRALQIPPKLRRRGNSDKPHSAKAPRGKRPLVVWFSPSGKQFTNKDADALAKYSDIVLVCGRYEGIDERAKKILKTLAPVKEFAVGEDTGARHCRRSHSPPARRLGQRRLGRRTPHRLICRLHSPRNHFV